MTGRDRIVLMGIVIVVVLAGGWMKLVSPERQKASKLAAQVATATAAVASAEGKLASARASQSQYPAAYAAMVSLGKAVPPNQEVPSLIFQLAEATSQKRVDFTSIATGAGGAASGSSTVTAPAPGKASPSTSSGTSASSAGTSGSSAGASASAGALTQMPFTFVFEGTFFDLERVMRELTSFTTRSSAGTLQVGGRLLTIQSVKLNPANTSGTGGSDWLTGTITATAYTAPAESASGATATAPATSAASPASSAAGSSSAPAPAVVRVSP